jgi:hypothetical protein
MGDGYEATPMTDDSQSLRKAGKHGFLHHQDQQLLKLQRNER